MQDKKKKKSKEKRRLYKREGRKGLKLSDRSLIQRRNVTKQENKSMTPWLERYRTQAILWGKKPKKMPLLIFVPNLETY